MTTLQEQDKNIIRQICFDPATAQRIIDLLQAAGNASQGATPIRVTAGQFSGNDYTNVLLIGKAAQVDFDVWSTSLLNLGSDYTFVGATGTITIPSGASDILILIYK